MCISGLKSSTAISSVHRHCILNSDQCMCHLWEQLSVHLVHCNVIKHRHLISQGFDTGGLWTISLTGGFHYNITSNWMIEWCYLIGHLVVYAWRYLIGHLVVYAWRWCTVSTCVIFQTKQFIQTPLQMMKHDSLFLSFFWSGPSVKTLSWFTHNVTDKSALRNFI